MRDQTPIPTKQRRSLRVLESAYIQFEVITDKEFSEGLERRKLRLGTSQGLHSILLDIDTRLDQQLFLIKANSSRIGECLSLINEKINAVIQSIPETRETKTSLAQTEPVICEIGAEGMSFCTERPIEPGTKLALRFLLESDNRYLETLGQAVRCVDPPVGACERRPHGVAVQFHAMKPAQKEVLIQHLFHQESETLRLRRLELDDMA